MTWVLYYDLLSILLHVTQSRKTRASHFITHLGLCTCQQTKRDSESIWWHPPSANHTTHWSPTQTHTGFEESFQTDSYKQTKALQVLAFRAWQSIQMIYTFQSPAQFWTGLGLCLLSCQARQLPKIWCIWHIDCTSVLCRYASFFIWGQSACGLAQYVLVGRRLRAARTECDCVFNWHMASQWISYWYLIGLLGKGKLCECHVVRWNLNYDGKYWKLYVLKIGMYAAHFQSLFTKIY